MKKHTKQLALSSLIASTLSCAPAFAGSGTGSVTLIQTGDIHGHLLPRYNLRSDAVGSSMEGGVARMYTVVQQMRKDATKCTYCQQKEGLHRLFPAPQHRRYASRFRRSAVLPRPGHDRRAE